MKHPHHWPEDVLQRHLSWKLSGSMGTLVVPGMAVQNAAIKVGIDWDGTMTVHHQAICALIGILGAKNCFIITARHPGTIAQTEQEAKEYGVPLEHLGGVAYYPEVYNYETMDVNPGWDKIIKFKMDACLEREIGVLIEDDPRYKTPLEEAGIQVILVE